MKKLVIAALFLTSCSSLKLQVVNTTGGPINAVEIKTSSQTTKLEKMAADEVFEQKLKPTLKTEVNVNYSNEKGQQYYTSSPIPLSPGDKGFVRLSVTAKGTLEAVDGRKE